MPRVQSRNKNNKITIILLTSIGLILLVAVLLLFNQRKIQDYIIVATNPIPDSTLQLVQRAGMSSEGEFYYKASVPKVSNASEFNSSCRDGSEQSDAVLGCYVNYQIYIYNIEDQRLDGIKEVTAAHETLHAVYKRLSPGDKNYVNGLIIKEYEKIKDEPEIKKRVEYYERTEPGELYNELHSILATEYKDIDRSLEEYYAKYFSDRQKSVNLYAKYISVVKQLDFEVASLSNHLDDLKSSLSPEIEVYNIEKEKLASDIDRFNSWANGSTPISQSEFYSQRQVLVKRGAALEIMQSSINSQIVEYNELVKKYNDAVWRANDLNKSLNSSLDPTPSIE